MKILAIETSGLVCGVAVAEDEKIISEIYLNDSFTHSKKLMPMVDEALKSANCDIADIELLAVSTGPGSFTGLRIGICTIKGIAEGLNIKIAPSTSLEVLANCCGAKDVIAMIDARNENVYAGRFNNGKLIKALTGRYDEVLNELDCNENTVFVGDGAENLKTKITEALGFEPYFAGERFKYPSAGVCALLAFEKYKNDEICDAEALEANYMRESQADRMKNR